jgi:Tfp pilus assembly protein PilF
MLKGMLVGLVTVLVLVACGPDTIFLRQGFDTPAHHVSNGNALLERNKFVDACREFERAKELDPEYAEAYVGLGIAYANRGDLEKGLEMMKMADAMASSQEERFSVQRGFDQLNRIRQK